MESPAPPPRQTVYGWLHLIEPFKPTQVIAKHPMTDSTLTFGRNKNCDVWINTQPCSKLHATISISSSSPPTATLETQSINGLLLNSRRINKGEVNDLKEGDVINICQRVFRFYFAPDGMAGEPLPFETPARPATKPKPRYTLSGDLISFDSSPSPPSPTRTSPRSSHSPSHSQPAPPPKRRLTITPPSSHLTTPQRPPQVGRRVSSTSRRISELLLPGSGGGLLKSASKVPLPESDSSDDDEDDLDGGDESSDDSEDDLGLGDGENEEEEEGVEDVQQGEDPSIIEEENSFDYHQLTNPNLPSATASPVQAAVSQPSPTWESPAPASALPSPQTRFIDFDPSSPHHDLDHDERSFSSSEGSSNESFESSEASLSSDDNNDDDEQPLNDNHNQGGRQLSSSTPATPVKVVNSGPQTQEQVLASLPRHSARRHSLREKVLIRRAILGAITPPLVAGTPVTGGMGPKSGAADAGEGGFFQPAAEAEIAEAGDDVEEEEIVVDLNGTSQGSALDSDSEDEDDERDSKQVPHVDKIYDEKKDDDDDDGDDDEDSDVDAEGSFEYSVVMGAPSPRHRQHDKPPSPFRVVAPQLPTPTVATFAPSPKPLPVTLPAFAFGPPVASPTSSVEIASPQKVEEKEDEESLASLPATPVTTSSRSTTPKRARDSLTLLQHKAPRSSEKKHTGTGAGNGGFVFKEVGLSPAMHTFGALMNHYAQEYAQPQNQTPTRHSHAGFALPSSQQRAAAVQSPDSPTGLAQTPIGKSASAPHSSITTQARAANVPLPDSPAATPIRLSTSSSLLLNTQQRAAAVPLPLSPQLASPPVRPVASPTVVSTPPRAAALSTLPAPITPLQSASRPPPVQFFSTPDGPTFHIPLDEDDSFESEMTSPARNHRIMPTPKSVLRPGPTKGRRKSLRGFLMAPLNGTEVKRVVFNETVFVQEILDIRDKSLHYKEPPKMVAMVSPDPSRNAIPGTPIPAARLSSRPPTPSTLTPRRAQRVPTASPSSAVRRVLDAAQQQDLATSPERRTARRLPPAEREALLNSLQVPSSIAKSSSAPMLSITPMKAKRAERDPLDLASALGQGAGVAEGGAEMGTPNLAAGFRKLFGPAKVASSTTPQLTGIRSLFKTPSKLIATPRFDGFAEMLRTPAAPETPEASGDFDSPTTAWAAKVAPQMPTSPSRSRIAAKPAAPPTPAAVVPPTAMVASTSSVQLAAPSSQAPLVAIAASEKESPALEDEVELPQPILADAPIASLIASEPSAVPSETVEALHEAVPEVQSVQPQVASPAMPVPEVPLVDEAPVIKKAEVADAASRADTSITAVQSEINEPTIAQEEVAPADVSPALPVEEALIVEEEAPAALSAPARELKKPAALSKVPRRVAVASKAVVVEAEATAAPVKRGRPTKAAAAPVKIEAPTAVEPVRRGRKPKAEDPGLAAEAAAEKSKAAAPAPRGRPKKVVEETAAEPSRLPTRGVKAPVTVRKDEAPSSLAPPPARTIAKKTSRNVLRDSANSDAEPVSKIQPPKITRTRAKAPAPAAPIPSEEGAGVKENAVKQRTTRVSKKVEAEAAVPVATGRALRSRR